MRMKEVVARCENSSFRAKFMDALRELEPVEALVIRLKYVDNKPWAFIRYECNYSERQCQRIARRAQDKLGISLGVQINGAETRRKMILTPTDMALTKEEKRLHSMRRILHEN